MDLIKIKSAISQINPNSSFTGGSWGSELTCAVSLNITSFFETNIFFLNIFQAAIKACTILNSNLAQIKAKLSSLASWEDIVTEANLENIDLCARYM